MANSVLDLVRRPRATAIGYARPPGDGGGSGTGGGTSTPPPPPPSSGGGGITSGVLPPVAQGASSASANGRIPGDSPNQGGDATAASLYGGGHYGSFMGPASSGNIFQGWLNGDPLYQQALAQIGAAAGSDKAALQQAVNQLMVNYGLTSNLERSGGELGLGGDAMSQLLGMLNPASAQAAAQNTAQGTSILGSLVDKNNTAMQSIDGGLAARGMLGSSDQGFREGQENLAYNQGIYNSLSRMLNSFTGDQQKLAGELSALYGAGGQFDKAAMDAWTRFVAAVRSGQVQLPQGTNVSQVLSQGPGPITPPAGATTNG